ncbi:MAG: glutamate 5-kinase [Alphaproteobacteria bacterium]|nr:glutamate 5-kinase [Alphaproteobacteria bacterium]
MTERARTGPLAAAKRVVLKIGSSLIVDDAGAPARGWLAGLAEDVAALRGAGKKVVVVSSGAVALGRGALKLTGALKLEQKQAAAAAGQARLMRAYEEALAPHGVVAAQALLTPDDTERRRRWLNARATLETLLDLGACPIVNENDTVATQEIRYGDNDRLAARVAQMISADALILLSDIDGLYECDPRLDPQAAHIPEVKAITPAIEAMAGGAGALGSGGMRTKIEAAKIALQAGCATAILDGREARPLRRMADGARATWFLPDRAARAAYKAWIAGSLSSRGSLHVDAGAAAALGAGKSLLAAGVTRVDGKFEKGDAVRVVGPDGREAARGITRFDAADADAIKGLKSAAIEAALGYAASAVLIHADDLVLS